MRRRLAIAAAIAAAGVVAVAGCGKTIDQDKAQSAIADTLAEHGMHAKVSCPSGRKAKKGDVFTCTAVDPALGTMTITVTQQNDDGDVIWRPDAELVETTKIAAEAQKQVPGATVTCPKPVALIKQDEVITCTIEKDGIKAPLEIKYDGEEVSWGVPNSGANRENAEQPPPPPPPHAPPPPPTPPK